MSYLRERPELIARFQGGERAALAEVYEAYLPLIRRALKQGFFSNHRNVVPGPSRADDVADTIQEVFERAFRREARLAYDGTRDYAPYLVVLARNTVITRYRKRSREILSADPLAASASEQLGYEGAGTALWLDARAQAIARSYASTLEGPLRAVHAARYVAALSQRDAARELNISRPKLRKLEDRIRQGLLAQLFRAGLVGDTPRAAGQRARATDASWANKERLG